MLSMVGASNLKVLHAGQGDTEAIQKADSRLSVCDGLQRRQPLCDGSSLGHAHNNMLFPERGEPNIDPKHFDPQFWGPRKPGRLHFWKDSHTPPRSPLKGLGFGTRILNMASWLISDKCFQTFSVKGFLGFGFRVFWCIRCRVGGILGFRMQG